MTAATAAATRIDGAAGDSDLVALVRSGYDDAFEQLYRRHHGHVTAIVARMVRDRTRTEDIVQDVFLSALRRLCETDSDILFRAWISEIARNASIDHFRRAGRTHEVSIDDDRPLAPTDAQRMSITRSPELAAISRERFGHLRGALDELSESHQRVIVLRELEGHSYREIAQLMDLSPSGVESTLFRARRRLEQEYEQLDSGVRCVATQAVIMRVADGAGSRRDRRKLHRHSLRCSICRRLARENGIEPLLPAGRGAKVAAWLPFPALLERRRTGIAEHIRGFFVTGSRQASTLAPASGPGWDQAAPAIGKGLALIAAVALMGQGPPARDGGSDPRPAKAPAAAPADTPAPTSLPVALPASHPAHLPHPAARHRAHPPGRATAVASPANTYPGSRSSQPPTARQTPRPRAAAPAMPATGQTPTVQPTVPFPVPTGAGVPAGPALLTDVVTEKIEPIKNAGQQVGGQLDELVHRVAGL